MSAHTEKIQSIIEKTFVSAIKRLSEEGDNMINDLYLQIDSETGELQIYDDKETLIGKVIIFDWIKKKTDDSPRNSQALPILRKVLTSLSEKDFFDNPLFCQPLSISLTDDLFIVIEELFFYDEDFSRLDDPLLRNLDEDLDIFIKNLLSD